MIATDKAGLTFFAWLGKPRLCSGGIKATVCSPY
ncbi:Uncharacterised protein [Citrobacter freundii]|nr:Uncharacterised protein [Citrobacter freundii]SUX74143.1 Uncharacterised protein [Citrobacter freundii]